MEDSQSQGLCRQLQAFKNNFNLLITFSGHYKCDVFRKEKMQWFNYNDLSVRSRSPERVLKGAEDVCYLLVYQLE
jgi:hypothetical protein